MSNALSFLVLLVIFIGVIVLALYLSGWRMKKACDFIIRDLREKEALDPRSAVSLPYSKSELIHIGLRDYRPRALEELAKLDVVRILEGGRYYLCEERARMMETAGSGKS